MQPVAGWLNMGSTPLPPERRSNMRKWRRSRRRRGVALGSIGNLDYVVLLCGDLESARNFYRDVMKFELEVEQPGWVGFRVGAGRLALRPRGAFRTWHDGPATAGGTGVQLAFRVAPSALDACHEALRTHGVAILDPPRDLPSWRHRTLFFRDPECNLIELFAEL
jgi:glyoxylase I family protein